MQDYPLVSIVTPSYNQGRFIEATIQSVLNQEYPNLEYIIIDGGSTDNTLDIIRKYEHKLTWISEKDKGQSDAINKGFKMATGEIVAWLNSDDTYEPGSIIKAVEFFHTHEHVSLVYGEGDIIDEHGNKVKRFEETLEYDLWTLIHVSDFIMQPTTFFKREALQEVGYVDENLYWTMDWDLWIKLGCRYEVGYINEVLANSREYAETKTSTGGWKRFKEIVYLMRKHGLLKYPPGYFNYASNTLYTEWKNNPILKYAAKNIIQSVHKIVWRRFAIRYGDRWVGPTYCLSFPKYAKKFTIKGQIHFNQLIPITIKLNMNQKHVRTIVIDQLGEFTINVDLIDGDNYHFVKVECDKYIIPSKQNKENKDIRKLSLIIDEVLHSY